MQEELRKPQETEGLEEQLTQEQFLNILNRATALKIEQEKRDDKEMRKAEKLETCVAESYPELHTRGIPASSLERYGKDMEISDYLDRAKQEILGGRKYANNLEILGMMGKNIAKGAGFVAGAALGSILFFPSFARLCGKWWGEEAKEHVIGFGGLPLIFIAGMNTAINLSMYKDTGNKLYLIPPAIQLGTNLASGLYEWFRYEKNKIKEEKYKDNKDKK